MNKIFAKYVQKHEKQVELFLCTNKMKIGDTITHINPINQIIFNKEFIIDDIKNDFFYCGEHVFYIKEICKIIALISSKATWVKEGDEFDEEQIKITKKYREWKKETLLYMEAYLDDPNDFEKPYDLIVEILCPTCKIFH